jgi:hypothetical protein
MQPHGLVHHISLTVKDQPFAASRESRFSKKWTSKVDSERDTTGSLGELIIRLINEQQVQDVVTGIRLYCRGKFLPRLAKDQGQIILGDEVGACLRTGLAVITPLKRLDALTGAQRQRLMAICLLRLLLYVSSGRMVGLNEEDVDWLSEADLHVPWSLDATSETGSMTILSQKLEPLLTIRPIKIETAMFALSDKAHQQSLLDAMLFDRVTQVLRGLSPRGSLEGTLSPDPMPAKQIRS